MGAAELRSAFNEAAPGYSCSGATLGYARRGGKETQVLTFSGTDPDGAPFEVKSRGLKADCDVVRAARSVAKSLVARQKRIAKEAEASS